MEEKDMIEKSIEIIRCRTNLVPEIGVILGSGLGDFAEQVEHPVAISYADIPGFPVSAVEGHTGRIIFGTCKGKNVAVMQGRVHYYEGLSQRAITLPVRILKRLGMTKMLITNAAGSTSMDLTPGTLMMIRGHINFSGGNPLIGENVEDDGPRFPDLSHVYDEEFRVLLRKVAKREGIELAEGVYMMHSGPSYASPAEVFMGNIIGASAIGMSTVPEVIVCAHCRIPVLGITCITNYGPGVSTQPVNHQEVIETASKGKDTFIQVLNLALEEVL